MASLAVLVYLALSGQQTALPFGASPGTGSGQPTGMPRLAADPSAAAAQDKSLAVTDGQAIAGHPPATMTAAGVEPHQPHSSPVLEPEIRRALGEILNTSSDGLVEETRNGVTRVDLQRRFQTAPVVTVDGQGNVDITDYSHLPAEPAEPSPP